MSLVLLPITVKEIAQTVDLFAHMRMSDPVEHQPTVEKGLKMKIKRKNPTPKCLENRNNLRRIKTVILNLKKTKRNTLILLRTLCLRWKRRRLRWKGHRLKNLQKREDQVKW